MARASPPPFRLRQGGIKSPRPRAPPPRRAAAAGRAPAPAALDTVLRAKWNAMRDALRAGHIVGAVSHIVADARDGYATAFQAIAARLVGIDAILTDVTYAEARGAALIYHATRTDDGVVK